MTEKEVIIDGNKIRYVEKKGDGKFAFVFLHGWGSNHTTLAPLYKHTDTMVAFDFPGSGSSSRVNTVWGLADYARTTEAVIEKTVSGKKLIVVAHSFGGRVLLKMLNQRSRDDIQQIICVGVPFVGKESGKAELVQWITKVIRPGVSCLPEKVVKRARKMWHRMVGAKDYGALEDEVMRKTFQNILREDMASLAAVLKNYTTDFIWGEHDTSAPLSEATSVAGVSGAAVHIIKGGDHFPFLGKTQADFIKVFKQVIKT